MILNSICLTHCQCREYHYNYVAHATQEKVSEVPEYFVTLCAMEKIKDKRNILTAPWVRPEDFNFYKELGIDRFKISGREMIKKEGKKKWVGRYNETLNKFNKL